jgi:hypothetical protein
VAAAALWFVLRPASEPADIADQIVDANPAHAAAPEPPPPPSSPAPPRAQPDAAARALVRPPAPPQGPPVVGPHADDPHEPGMRPHPMDEAHARIDAENQLILRLNDAMSFRKAKEMREMILEYQKLDPADTDANQAGYTVIADCIEHPGDTSLAAAHQFYDTQRHSPLRRFVRRICFENTN